MAHQHVDGQAEFGESGQLGVAESAGEAEPTGLPLLSVIFTVIPLDQDAANPFFQLIASGYEQGSVMVTSNQPFGRWGETWWDMVVLPGPPVDSPIPSAVRLAAARFVMGAWRTGTFSRFVSDGYGFRFDR
ncbi:ATP-binding protein [Streptomyces sp. NPDC127084]|uniref:ATP-binding protein n=1 Tax=Streptomyces sp. NPDC127084 TaxID=3347133 RepID=UPI00364E858E